ncbi:hypothetical protein M0L20_21955 [Spirosoma sp. RP8]|uniref:Uncharacterized protein n=1 Tax=Spirosoma liriopis TaxID=2937440 RepID=A0ABT0HQW2_9BACT|nr:hypothetical protein [Spirosoma liriopis]MCK8494549.1 hypothetical protein [Spirosoma liriopis]
MMGRIFILAGLLLCFAGCKQQAVDASVSACYANIGQLTRSQRVVDAPVTVVVSGGLRSGGQLIPANGVPWNACNLPFEFQRDSLAIYVSGYFLTSPELERMNVSLLPFEVTSSRLR